jgi:hypothetical protein
LLRLFPHDASHDTAETASPWLDFPPRETNRLLLLNIHSGAEDDVLNEALDLANEHALVLYDPQGPNVYLPFRLQPEDQGFDFVGYAKILLFGLGSVALFVAGWWLPVPVLNWLLMFVGGFLTSVVVFLLVILAGGAKEDRR